MNVNIRNVSRRPSIALVAVSMIAMLLLSLGPAFALPNVGTATVMGTVTDINDGEPIEGALVTISYHGIVRTDVTDATGGYKFTNVPECFCLKNIEVTKDGYRPESKDVGVSGITVVDFELMTEELEPYMGTIMGTVSYDYDGTPIEGARVDLEYHGTIRTVFTDAEGEYRFDRVPECFCLKNITANADHYRPQTKSVGVSGITVVDFELENEEGMPPTGSLSGHVTDADTGLPIAGATVTLEYHDNTLTTTTDAEGVYVFPEVPICRCMKDLSIEADGYVGEERQVAVGEDTVENFALEPEDGGSTGLYGTLSGIVTDADTDLPIEGAEVTLKYHDAVRTVITNADGLYVIPDVPLCFCMKDLSVEADGYVGEERQVAVGENTVEDFTLEPEDGGPTGSHGTLSGIVTDADTGLPIAGAEVTLKYHDVVRTATTNADGFYVFTDVPICYCMKDLSVEADGYEGRSMQVAVGEQTVQDVTLEPEDLVGPVIPNGAEGRDQPILSGAGYVALATMLGVIALLGLVLFVLPSMRRRDQDDE